jgi:hypothetical protein
LFAIVGSGSLGEDRRILTSDLAGKIVDDIVEKTIPSPTL